MTKTAMCDRVVDKAMYPVLRTPQYSSRIPPMTPDVPPMINTEVMISTAIKRIRLSFS